MSTTLQENVLISRNPATGAELGRVDATPPEQVAEIVARAREAQRRWGALSWRERRPPIERLWKILSRDADGWAEAIAREIGKPRAEALAGDVVATLDLLRWTVKHSGRVLADDRIGPGWQRALLVGSVRVAHRPLGVVGVIGTWNYVLYLNAPPIAQALAAGNAVVWKPSELAPLAGIRLQHSFEEAGFPAGLVSAVFGGPDVGAALVESNLDKGVFTGGVGNGRRVLGALAARGIPAIAELSGFDPAVILPDAPLESTIRALTWAAFVGCGQTCVAVKRVLVVGDPRPWAEALAAEARKLRIGDPLSPDVDLGPMISEPARARFHETIRATASAGARILCGGEPGPSRGWFYPPTVLLAESAAAEDVLAGAFGPVVLVRGVSDADDAVTAANASSFGLAASVWGRDLRNARSVARRIDAGLVSINDAVTPACHAGAPFGGVKASGYGRVHGALGLREFTLPQALSSKRPGGFRPQLFPYSTLLPRILAVYRRLFH